MILAVADGHGSAASFRSDRGARMAVEAALFAANGLLRLPMEQQRSLSLAKHAVEHELPRGITRRWRESVRADLRRDPYSEEELASRRGRRGEGDAPADEEDLLPYGATLIVAIATGFFFGVCQLGDGDVLTVSQDGKAARIFPDDRSLGDETLSLCLPEPWRYTRSCFKASYASQPALIVLATDGFSNSFSDDDSFLEAVGSLLPTIATRGAQETARELHATLAEMSDRGSGDDITLGIIWRLGAVPHPPVPKEDG